jgi:hypothetical protein
MEATDEIEKKIRMLCWRASNECNAGKLRVLLAEVRQILLSNPQILRSMSDETYDALWRRTVHK